MLTNRTLSRINNRPREVARVPLLAAGGGTLVLVAPLYVFEILPPLTALAVLGGGVLLTLLLYLSQKAKTTISLSYKGKLDDKVAARFSEVQDALEGLASSEGIWSLPASSMLPKAGEVAPTTGRDEARVGLLPTPGIKSDVPIWGIEATGGTLHFFPEGTLYHKNDRYSPVSYDALKMTLSSGRFFEEGELSSDATVVKTVWRYSRPDGSPDPRHKNDNVEIPVVLYDVLGIKGSTGLDVLLMVSNRRAAVRFAKAFRAKDLREKKRKNADAPGKAAGGASTESRAGRGARSVSPEEIEREVRLTRARKILGVSKGATQEEISTTYRKLALAHHPDRVVHLEREAREYSEQRMKEINIAYAELKGHGGSVAAGARTV